MVKSLEYLSNKDRLVKLGLLSLEKTSKELGLSYQSMQISAGMLQRRWSQAHPNSAERQDQKQGVLKHKWSPLNIRKHFLLAVRVSTGTGCLETLLRHHPWTYSGVLWRLF